MSIKNFFTEIEQLEVLPPPKRDKEFIKIVVKYTSQTIPSLKGKKTLQTLLKRYWLGGSLTLKELLMINSLWDDEIIDSMNLQNVNVFKNEIKKEIENKTNEKLSSIEIKLFNYYLLKRKLLMVNPNYSYEAFKEYSKIT